MSSNIFVNGVDLDNIFAPRTSSASTNTLIMSQSVDIANRYERLSPLRNDGVSFNTNLQSGSIDLRYFFRDLHSQLQYSGSSASYDAFETYNTSSFVSLWSSGSFWPATGAFFYAFESTSSDDFESYNSTVTASFTSTWGSGSGLWAGSGVCFFPMELTASDDFEAYNTSSNTASFISSWGLGFGRWIGSGSCFASYEISGSDDFELYSAGSIINLLSGSGWFSNGRINTIFEYLATDDFEEYQTGSITSLASGSYQWSTNTGSFV